MKAKLLLAETATNHPDGTISALRLGISHVWGEAFPIPLHAALIVQIEASIVDAGGHSFEIRGLTTDGQPFMPTLSGQFEVPKEGGQSNMILQFAVGFAAYGAHIIAVLIDRVEQDRMSITVMQKGKGATP